MISLYVGHADWAIVIRDQQTGELQISQLMVANKPQVGSVGKRFSSKAGIINWVAQYGKAMFVHNVDKDKRYAAESDRIIDKQLESLAVLPIDLHDEVLGVLAIFNPRALPYFGDLEMRFLLAMTGFIAISIGRSRRIEALETAAMTDPLTQQYNRRGFIQIIDQEIERCRRYNRAVSLMIIDIDDFKIVNDTLDIFGVTKSCSIFDGAEYERSQDRLYLSLWRR